MKRPLTIQLPQLTSNSGCTKPSVDASQGKLVQNFLTALNKNYRKSNSHLSQSTTENSDQANLHQNQTQSFSSCQKQKNYLNTPFYCQQRIKSLPVIQLSMKTNQLYNQLNKIKINPLYFVCHSGIKTSSRAILMDWITEVCQEFHFLRTTCCQTKTLIDIYLSKTSKIDISQLQLVGITCLFIISKLEQSMPKTLVEMAYATACLYNVEQIRTMQTNILTELLFQVQFPGYQSCIKVIVNQWQKYKNEHVDSLEFNLKEGDPQSVRLQQNLRWIIDVIRLDSESLNYNHFTLTVSVFVLLLGYHNGWYSLEDIQYSFVYNCRYLTTTSSYFLSKVQQFLNRLHLALWKLTSGMQMASSYFFLVNLSNTPQLTQIHNKFSLYYVKYRKQLVKQIQLIFQ